MRFLAVLVLCSAGCSLQHVVVPDAPAATSALSERDAYYEDWKPLGIAGEPMVQGGLAANPFPNLQLANGRRVVDAMDLLPAVDPHGLTATAAHASEQDRLLGTALTVGGTIGVSLGITALFLGETVGLATINGGDPTIPFIGAAAGVGIAALGTAALIGGATLDGEADAERMTAFLCYEPDLRRRLALKRPDEALERKWALDASPPPSTTSAPKSSSPPSTPPPSTPPPSTQPDPAEP